MAKRVDPYKNFNFRVEIDGIQSAGFSEVTGLSTEVECIEYREGGDITVRKLAGLRKYSNIVLKRGVTKSADLQNWHRNVLNGVTDRRNGSVILLDEEGNEVVRWNFSNAFPRKWEGPHLKGDGNEVAIESLELCCEGIERSS
jgi:phage tail-like protein